MRATATLVEAILADASDWADFQSKSITTTSTGANNAILGNLMVGSRLQINGTTASYPALRNAGAVMEFVTADNSAYTSLTATTAIFNALASDATHTDKTVCADSTTGQLYAGSGTIGICLGTSSERYKHGLSPLKAGLNEILQLHPKQGFYNQPYGDPKKLTYWVTAEDAAPVLPALVGLDAAGRPNSMDLVGLVPALVNAVKEQQAQIELLKKEIMKLKAGRR